MSASSKLNPLAPKKLTKQFAQLILLANQSAAATMTSASTTLSAAARWPAKWRQPS